MAAASRVWQSVQFGVYCFIIGCLHVSDTQWLTVDHWPVGVPIFWQAIMDFHQFYFKETMPAFKRFIVKFIIYEKDSIKSTS